MQKYPGELEVLEHTTAAIRAKRLENGAPLLMNHDRDALIGVITGHSIIGNKLRITAKLSDTPKGNDAWRMIQEGILRHASIGYRIHASKLASTEGDNYTYQVTETPCL